MSPIRSISTPIDDKFAPSTQAFVQLNLDAIARELKLAETGAERGRANIPPATAQMLDDVEHKITHSIDNEVRRQQQSFSDQMTAYHQRIASLNLESAAIEMSSAAQTAISEFNVQVLSGKNDLFRMGREVEQAEAQWKNFRAANNLTGPAHYPTSKLWSFAVIASLLAIEGFANGQFLAQGLTTGLVGGIVSALVIAFMNVTTGLAFGHVIARGYYHKSIVRKLSAFFGSISYLGFVAGFNLLVGHYRDALGGEFPEQAAKLALQNFAQSPFSLAEFSSWILFGVGVLFSFIAADEGLKLDDPYPGYGKIDRQHRDILREYSDEKSAIIDQLRETRDNAVDEMKEAQRVLSERRNELSTLLVFRSRLIKLYESHTAYLQDCLDSLLSTYRNANLRARTEPAPAYFSSPRKRTDAMDIPELPAFIDEQRLSQNVDTTNAALSHSIERVHAEFDEAIRQFKQVDLLAGDKQPEMKIDAT